MEPLYIGNRVCIFPRVIKLERTSFIIIKLWNILFHEKISPTCYCRTCGNFKCKLLEFLTLIILVSDSLIDIGSIFFDNFSFLLFITIGFNIPVIHTICLWFNITIVIFQTFFRCSDHLIIKAFGFPTIWNFSILEKGRSIAKRKEKKESYRLLICLSFQLQSFHFHFHLYI